MLDYKRFAPQGTFLRYYLDLMDRQETPLSYDFWCGMWILSNVVGRSAVVARPRAPVFLNLFLFIVADSGITRKSTAIDNASDVLQQYVSEHKGLLRIKHGVRNAQELYTNSVTPTNDASTSHTALAGSELERITGGGSAKAVTAALTELFDCPSYVEGGVSSFTTLVAAATPNSLSRTLSKSEVKSGFASRVFVLNEYAPKRRQPWPTPEDEERTTRTRAVDRLRDIGMFASQKGAHQHITLSDGAMTTFSRWYRNRTLSTDQYLSSFEAREDSHVLKVAALLSINEGFWKIQRSHLRAAQELMREVKAHGALVFSGTGGYSRMASHTERLRQTLIKAGTMGKNQSTLNRLSPRISSDTTVTILQTMKELSMVQEFRNVRTNRHRKPTTVWRATQEIERQDAVQAILRNLPPVKED